jgi:hypothetical protein
MNSPLLRLEKVNVPVSEAISGEFLALPGTPSTLEDWSITGRGSYVFSIFAADVRFLHP